MHRVQVIVGSVRPTRIGDQVADWLVQSVSGVDGMVFDTVDLRDWPLPLAGEPELPADGVYCLELTRAWSTTIAAADGYVFVTPQYNWGYPAALKNALDHLFREWNTKPAVIVSYGFHGGGKAASQLRQVLTGLRMRPTATMPALTVTSDMINPAGKLADPAADFACYHERLHQSMDELTVLLAG